MKRFAVVGDPISHSLSPRMHQAAYTALGLPHRYEALHTTAADLPAVVADLRAGRLDGCNVTLPHKQRVSTLVDRVTDSARSFGVANTLLRARDGAIVAHNTDIPALEREIDELAVVAEKTVLVLGSGGAARAAIAALASLRVARIVLRARAEASWIQPIAVALGGTTRLVAEPFEAGESEREVALVVQATSLGLASTESGQLAADAVDWSRLPRGTAALDLIYAPPRTPFLRAAAAAHLRHANGLGMLARQGALAFEAWLGIPAPLYTMWNAIQ